MMEENNNIFLDGVDALMHLVNQFTKKYSSTINFGGGKNHVVCTHFFRRNFNGQKFDIDFD